MGGIALRGAGGDGAAAVRQDACGPEHRRRAYVAAARDSFFAKGYADVTMSSIAASVGGSKTTLWTCFPSKAALFAAVVDDIVEHYGAALRVELSLEEPVETVLRRYAGTLLATLLSPPILRLHRLVIGEAERFPQLARMLFERGPQPGQERLRHYFETLMANGRLARGDPVLAVRQFVGLCQGGRYQLAILGIDVPATGGSMDHELDAAVSAFAKLWLAAR